MRKGNLSTSLLWYLIQIYWKEHRHFTGGIWNVSYALKKCNPTYTKEFFQHSFRHIHYREFACKALQNVNPLRTVARCIAAPKCIACAWRVIHSNGSGPGEMHLGSLSSVWSVGAFSICGLLESQSQERVFLDSMHQRFEEFSKVSV